MTTWGKINNKTVNNDHYHEQQIWLCMETKWTKQSWKRNITCFKHVVLRHVPHTKQCLPQRSRSRDLTNHSIGQEKKKRRGSWAGKGSRDSFTGWIKSKATISHVMRKGYRGRQKRSQRACQFCQKLNTVQCERRSVPRPDGRIQSAASPRPDWPSHTVFCPMLWAKVQEVHCA